MKPRADPISEARVTRVGARTVAWTVFGDAGGRPAVYYHGAGGSRLEAAVLDHAAAAASLRIMAIDRPGYGRTDPVADRSLLSCVAEDLPAVLDAEGVRSAAVCGLSAGAMYAWAAAHRHPARVDHVVAVSPAVPGRHRAVQRAMPAQMKVVCFLSRHVPALLARAQRKRSEAYLSGDPDSPAVRETVVGEMHKVSPADAELLRDPNLARWFVSAAVEGRRQGGSGVEEFALMTTPWGFDPGASEVGSTLVYGDQDPLAPMIAAWAESQPRIELCRVVGGHLQTALPDGRAAVIAALGRTPSPQPQPGANPGTTSVLRPSERANDARAAS